MTDMLERAARAVYAVELARDENCNSLIIQIGGHPHPSTRIEAFEESPKQWAEYAQAALLAALDPSDDAVVEAMARAIREEVVRQYRDDDRKKWPGLTSHFYEEYVAPRLVARAALSALREMVEGEQA